LNDITDSLLYCLDYQFDPLTLSVCLLAGQQVTELGFADLSKVSPFDGESGFLGSKQHTGLLFIRPTFQCLKGLCLPDPPYLFAIWVLNLNVSQVTFHINIWNKIVSRAANW